MESILFRINEMAQVMVIDNFTVVLTMHGNRVTETRNTPLHQKQQAAGGWSCHKLQEIRHLVNYNGIHNKMWTLMKSNLGSTVVCSSTSCYLTCVDEVHVFVLNFKKYTQYTCSMNLH